MSRRMRKILESKRAMRKQLATLPFSEKVLILEKLRDRSLLIAASPLRRPLTPSRIQSLFHSGSDLPALTRKDEVTVARTVQRVRHRART